MSKKELDAHLARAFGSRVRALREARGVSQEELSAAAELHRSFVGKLERGESSPSLATIVRLADELQIAPEELVRGLRDGST